MSSFKKAQERVKIQTGIPLIDQVLGKLSPGSMILIKEDEFSYIHNILLNTFISEGRRSKEKNILVAAENKSNVNFYEVNTQNEVENDLKKMFIAWRYSNLKLESPDYKFSLSSKIEYNEKLLTDTSVMETISRLKSHRISLFSLYAPSYQSESIEKDLHRLRRIVRQNEHICMASIPTFLHPNIHFESFFDVVLRLDSNLLTGVLPNYRATIEFEKFASYGTLRCLDLESYKFGIKFKKDRLVIESIDIPPDEREPIRDCSAF